GGERHTREAFATVARIAGEVSSPAVGVNPQETSVNRSRADVDSSALSRIQADAARYLADAVEVLRATADTEAERVARVSALLAARLRHGGTLYTCGNGGSAADAQHVATELAGKFFLHRPGLPAIALTTNTSALTAIANDFSYDEVFVRQLSGLARPGDM